MSDPANGAGSGVAGSGGSGAAGGGGSGAASHAASGAAGGACPGRLSLSDELGSSGLAGGLSPERLAAEFGTPLYIYDLDVIAARVASLRAALPRGFRLAYAVKANPALALVARLAGLGVGADVASGGELETARRAGFRAETIVFTGPGKRDVELEAAVELGVAAVTVESPGELARLEAIAARAGRRQPVLLRLAVAEDGGSERVRLIGGGGGKFGMSLADLGAAAACVARSASLELLGVHAFGASNLLDPAALAGHVASLVQVGLSVAKETGLPLRLVDAGGGLGIPYRDGEAPLDLADLGARLADLRAAWDGDPALAEMEVLLEPGRFLVGPAGAYLARVVDVKGPADHPVAILEGGINHAVRPALVRQEHRLCLLPAAGPGAERAVDRVPVTVAGPLCTGIDVFAGAAVLPPPSPGDLVALLDVGAYGFSESMPLFLSHPTPAEVAIQGGRARLIRAPITPLELLDRQIVPDW